jgi:hypothetical protein
MCLAENTTGGHCGDFNKIMRTNESKLLAQSHAVQEALEALDSARDAAADRVAQ